jgi:hypothetical protein
VTLDVFALDATDLTKMPGITIFKGTHSEVDTAITTMTDQTKRNVTEKDILYFSKEFRVLCEKLPRRTSVEIAFAVAQPNLTSDFLLIKGKRAFEFKAAYPQFAPNTIPSKISMTGTYEAFAGRPRKLDEAITVIQR